MSIRKSNYDKHPVSVIRGYDSSACTGYDAIEQRLRNALESIGKHVMVFECYPGVDKQELRRFLDRFSAELLIDSDTCAYSGSALDEMLQENLTNDRVFGIVTTKKLNDYYDTQAAEEAKQRIAQAQGLVIVYGTGASYVAPEESLLVYCDLARWEIQLRYRRGMGNWNTDNCGDPILTKYKRGFFVEWRLADKLKKQLFSKMDFILDTNIPESPNMVEAPAFFDGLHQISRMPFRVQPYFDPGVWGGQWMKDVCGLDKNEANFAWSFDGVPEENALAMRYGDVTVTVPAIDLVFYCAETLLGSRVHARFGTEFPIRFDFLDTMEGQNLSLQVHPLTEYIQENFNMRYTQDESYYILDAAEEDTYVYLGVKTGVDKAAMMMDLRRAEKGEISFPDEKYINKIPVKKHDHVLIPAGTIHCSGSNTMVLEISATPYIFTFKLWDWDRIGLDGLPRPIHIDHGEKNIQWNRDTEWVMSNLVGQEYVTVETDALKVEHTGLHEREFIETRRYSFAQPCTMSACGSVRMCNLVEGDEITISSPDGAFEPYEIHYAETFIIPDGVSECLLTPSGPSAGKEVKVIVATVRQ